MDISQLVCSSVKCYHGVAALGLCDTHYRAELRKKRPLYGTWLNIKQRCYNIDHPSYRFYGALGIKVCDRWRTDYRAFVDDMGERPVGTVLDRIDESEDFTPENCCWVPRARVYARVVKGASL